jgi:5-methylcytosine-specific restriction protein A
MPHKPKKPCRYPACAKLTNNRYCEEHKKEMDKRYNKYQRDKDTNKRYGSAWRKARKKYISNHPLCEQSRSYDRLTPAMEVHHIIPLSEGGTHNENNLMALCKSCHSRITATECKRWN